MDDAGAGTDGDVVIGAYNDDDDCDDERDRHGIAVDGDEHANVTDETNSAGDNNATVGDGTTEEVTTSDCSARINCDDVATVIAIAVGLLTAVGVKVVPTTSGVMMSYPVRCSVLEVDSLAFIDTALQLTLPNRTLPVTQGVKHISLTCTPFSCSTNLHPSSIISLDRCVTSL